MPKWFIKIDDALIPISLGIAESIFLYLLHTIGYNDDDDWVQGWDEGKSKWTLEIRSDLALTRVLEKLKLWHY